MKKIVLSLLIVFCSLNIYSQISDPLNSSNSEIKSVSRYSSDDYDVVEVVEKNSENLKVIEESVAKENSVTSVIENRLSVGSDKKLKQFGYDYLFLGKNDPSLSSNRDYILGPGDSIRAYIWGDPVDIMELKGQYKIKVDSTGNLYFPGVGIVSVTGKSVEEVQDIIIAGLKEKYRQFNLELVVSEFKTFSISVSGMVNRPGQINCNALTSLTNALGLAGGIDKSGSLRNIEVKRNGKVLNFDLYDLLIKGDGEITSFLIKQGDVIYVNPIGDVAAIRGSVKRPGIYEVKNGETVKDLLYFSGGKQLSTLDRDVNLYKLDKKNGNLVVLEDINASILDYPLSDGAVIDVPEVQLTYSNSITVSGAIKNPGRFSLKDNTDLNSMLKNIEFRYDTNMMYGEVIRNEIGERKEFFTFTPSLVLKGIQNMRLSAGDKILFKSYSDTLNINSNNFRDIVTFSGVVGGSITISWNDNLNLNDILTEELLPVDYNEHYATILRRSESGTGQSVVTFSPMEILQEGKILKLERLDRVIFYPKWEYRPIVLTGEVDNSYSLTYFPGITLMEVFRGVKFRAPVDELRVRVIQKSGISNIYLYDLLNLGNPRSDIPLEPGASILVQKVTDRENRSHVKVLGQVNKPGIVSHSDNLTLYELLKSSAKGFRNDAYLKGLVVIRKSAKDSQQKQLDITLNTMAAQLESMKTEALNSSMSPEAKTSVSAQIASQEALLKLTREKAKMSLGRLSLELPETLEELKNHPSNIELEEGDYIYVPKKPDYILVLGNVYNQISINYKPDMTVEEYLNRVGGFKSDSDKPYIVHINGEISSADSVGFFSKSIKNRTLSPGDVIVVPQRVSIPGHIVFVDTLETVVDILFKTTTSILSTNALLTNLGAI